MTALAADTQIGALESELDRLLPEAARGEQLPLTDDTPTPRIVHRRGRKGLKTPELAYLRPILEILVELGGSGDANVVLDLLYAKMAPVLNEYDHTPLASDGVTPRWRNTAQWARNNLREQGLIRPDSPRGVWIISETGRAWLRQG